MSFTALRIAKKRTMVPVYSRGASFSGSAYIWKGGPPAWATKLPYPAKEPQSAAGPARCGFGWMGAPLRLRHRV